MSLASNISKNKIRPDRLFIKLALGVNDDTTVSGETSNSELIKYYTGEEIKKNKYIYDSVVFYTNDYDNGKKIIPDYYFKGKLIRKGGTFEDDTKETKDTNIKQKTEKKINKKGMKLETALFDKYYSIIKSFSLASLKSEKEYERFKKVRKAFYKAIDKIDDFIGGSEDEFNYILRSDAGYNVVLGEMELLTKSFEKAQKKK
jgi:hypothetical protein